MITPNKKIQIPHVSMYDRLQATIVKMTWECQHCHTVYTPKMILTNGHADLNWDEIVEKGKCPCPASVAENKGLLVKQQLEAALEHRRKLENHPRWQEFNPNWPKRPESRQMLKLAQEFVMASHLNQLPGCGLVMSGQIGCGKTMLLETLTQANNGLILHENSIKTALVTNNAEKIKESAIKRKVLLLDDIGGEELDEEKSLWVKRLLGNFYNIVLGEREKDKSKRTYFTTNCPYFPKDEVESPLLFPSLVEKIGQRAFERIENIFSVADNWIDLSYAPSYRSRNLREEE